MAEVVRDKKIEEEVKVPELETKTTEAPKTEDDINFKEVAHQLAVVVNGLHHSMQQMQLEIGSLKQPAHTTQNQTEEVDFDDMSNKDLVSYLSESITNRVRDEITNSLRLDMENVQADTKRKEILEDVKQLEKTEPDFWEWRTEMQGIVNTNPLLTAEQAYVLAKRSNPSKAAKLDAKFHPAPERKFFGLTPTSNPTSPAHNKRMSIKDASTKAWDDVFGKNDHI